MYRCRICGETYLGTHVPSRCPFCGAHEEYMGGADSFAASENDVQLTERERGDLEAAVELERSNTRYYIAVAQLDGDEALSSAYKRLSRIEAEHCSLFCKLLRQAKPDDLGTPADPPADWCSAIAESRRREQAAAAFYAEAAGRATNARVIEVFTAVTAIESDHIDFDDVAGQRAECSEHTPLAD